MKSKLVIFFLIITLLMLTTFSYIIYSNNQELKEQLELRNKLIKTNQQIDSLNSKHDKEYEKTVTKYVTRDCGIMIGKKEVSLDEFINIYITQLDSLSELHREKYYIKDSLNMLRKQIEQVKKMYSLNINSKIEGDYRVTSFESSQMDSALILLKHFRDRLSYDSASKVWTIKK